MTHVLGRKMFIEQVPVGGDRNFGYLVADEEEKKAIVIDPSFSPERLVEFARTRSYEILYVFNTHDHSDHTNGNAAIERLTNHRALLYGSTDPLTNLRVVDGTVFPLGGLEVKIIHTPGHTPDSICILIGDAVFTGDTLFVGKVGGTDLGSGAETEYASLHEKLLTLPDATRVFPGHDYGTALASTIGNERRTNPFLLQPDFESFVHLKRNWLTYKKEHGIA